jgi:hypothetical protein
MLNELVAKMKGFTTELIAAGHSIDDDELRDLISTSSMRSTIVCLPRSAQWRIVRGVIFMI